MQKVYQITSNSFYFGLTCNGEEVLPCVNSKLWRLTEDLIGFRQGALFGIYSLQEERVVHEPVLQAEIPYFKPFLPDRQNKVTEPRYASEQGYFVKRKAYLETYDYLLWKKHRLYVMGTDGVVVILQDGEVRPYNGRNPALVANKLSQRCLYQGEYGEANLASLGSFEYLSKKDEDLDEQNFLKNVGDNSLDFSGRSEAEQEDPEAADEKDGESEDDEPIYKHYDYDAIPAVIIEKFMKHLDEMTNNKKSAWLAKVLIYLAWCHANGFVEYDERGNCILDPLYALQPEDAEVITDIAWLYRVHELQGLQYLLYLSPVTEGYLDVLAFEN